MAKRDISASQSYAQVPKFFTLQFLYTHSIPPMAGYICDPLATFRGDADLEDD